MTDLIIKSESLFLTSETNQIIYVPVSDVIMDTDSSTSFQILRDESTVHVVMQDTLIQEQESGSFEDAAFDNKTYGRKNGIWVQIPPQTNDAYLYGKVDEFSTFKLNAEGLGIDPNDKLISINNLIDYGLLDNDLNNTLPKDEITPPIPEGLVVSGTVGGIRLRWIPAHTQYKNHSLTQVWRSQTDSRITAVKIADVLAHSDFEDSNTTFGINYYYWIKFVNLQGTIGNFNGLPGTAGTMVDASDSIIDQISNNIRGSELYQDLLTPIGELNTATAGLLTITAAHAADLVNETSNRTAALLAESTARTTALQEEEIARVLAIAVEATLRQNALVEVATDAAEALASEVTARQVAIGAEAAARQAALVAEAQARADALLDEGTARVAGLLAEATARGSAISTLTDYVDEQDESLASQITTVTAAVGSNAAAIQAEQTARATAIEAEALARTTLAVRVSTAETAITTEQTARANQDLAIAGQITTINASLGTNAAAIQTEQQARATAIEAEALARTTLAARVTNAESAIVVEQNTRATQDSAIAGQITTLTTGVNDNATAITNEINNRTTAVSAEATARNTLSSKIMGAGNPNNLSEVSGGLFYEAKESITNLEGSLTQQIALLSAGSNNQFDYAKIWYFDSGTEGWWAPAAGATAVNGWIRPPVSSDPYVGISLVNNIDGTKYPQVRARIRKVGNPTWYGYFSYLIPSDQVWGVNGKLTTTDEPDFDENNIGNVTWNMSGSWSANQITHFLYQLSVTADASNYYEVDWIAVGRPSPGASSADLYTEQTARTNADGALSQQITSLSGVVDGKASGSALSALTVRVEDTEDSISSTSSDLTLLKSKLAFAENTLDPSVWVVGTQGSQGAWSVNGAANESEIVLAGSGTVPLGPLGQVEKLWQCQELGENGASGGYNVAPTAANKIDKSIGTVFSAFVRHNGATSGHIYHGCDVNGGTEDLGDTVNWNPYWVYHPVGAFTANKWYLLYGVIQPEGGNTPTGLSGIYDCETGIRIVDVPDFRCSPNWNTVNQVYRNYWYYSDDTTHKVWFAQPRVVPLNQSLSPWQLMSINPLLSGTATALETLDTKVTNNDSAQSTKLLNLRAQLEVKSLVANPYFIDWVNGWPVGWYQWNAIAPTQVINGVQFVIGSGQSGGIYFPIPFADFKNIDVELTFTITSGELNGVGVWLEYAGNPATASSAKLTDYYADASPILNKKITLNLRLKRQSGVPNSATNPNLFLMAGFSGLGTLAAKTIIFHSCVATASDQSAEATESLLTRVNNVASINGVPQTIEVISAKTITLESTIGDASSGVLHDLAATTVKANNAETALSTGSHSLINLTSAMNGAAATAASNMRTEITNDPEKGLTVLSNATTLLKNTLNGSDVTAFGNLKTSINNGMATASDVTLLKAQLPGGVNLIKSDSEFELTNPNNTAIGWYTISDGSVTLAYKNHAGAGYTPVGFDQIGCNGNGQTPSYIDLRAYSSNEECITVVQGQRYCFSAYTANHRCALIMHIIWYNEAGSQIVPSATIESPISASGGTALNAFAFNYVFGTPPVGATRAGLIVRGYRNNGESDPYIWACQPMFCEVHADATVPPKYSPSLAGPFAAVAKEALARQTADGLMASDITDLKAELGVEGTAEASTGLIAQVTKAKADIGTLPVGVTSLSAAFTSLNSTVGDANSGAIQQLNAATGNIGNLTTAVNTNSSAITALNSQQNINSILQNPHLNPWTGVFPDAWGAWYSPPIKHAGSDKAQFNVAANEYAGLQQPIENYKYIDVELTFMLISGGLSGAGILVQWFSPGYHSHVIRLADLYPDAPAIYGKKITAKFRMKRPATYSGTYTEGYFYLMANYDGLGAFAAKNIIYYSCVATNAGTSANAFETLETAVNHTDTGLVATANKVLNLESTMGSGPTGMSARLEAVAATTATLAGAQSSYGVKVNITGGTPQKVYAAGFAIGASYDNATNTGLSNFGINADTFFITNNGVGDVQPFVVTGNTIYMNAAVIGDATISRAKIGELNVTTLDGDTLAFIKANIGTVVTDDIQGYSDILYNLNSTEPVQIGNAGGSVYGTEGGSAPVGWVNIPARTNNRAYGLQFFVQGSVLKDTAGTATITAEFFTANSNAAAGTGVTMSAPFTVGSGGFNCIRVTSDPSDPTPASWSNFTVGSVAVVYKDANNFIEGIVEHVQYVSQTPYANTYVRGTAVSLREVIKIGASVPSDGTGCTLYSKSVANRYYKKLGISLSTTINTTSASQSVKYNMSYLDTSAKTTAGVNVLCVLSHVGTGPCTNQSVDFTLVSAR